MHDYYIYTNTRVEQRPQESQEQLRTLEANMEPIDMDAGPGESVIWIHRRQMLEAALGCWEIRNSDEAVVKGKNEDGLDVHGPTVIRPPLVVICSSAVCVSSPTRLERCVLSPPITKHQADH